MLNWYPDYWTQTEKNKLFDYWRFRYSKNKLWFSTDRQEHFGGYGFYDASYESLKYPNLSPEDKYQHIEQEYQARRASLKAELLLSQLADQKRLMLLLDAEEKAFQYWSIKMLYSPIKEDVPAILKQAIWLIDEKERIFKEAFSHLIEYDRKYLSALSFPEKSLSLAPEDAKYWLCRDGRTLSEKDQAFFKTIALIENTEKQQKYSYIPKLLLFRHQTDRKKEESRHIFRSINGNYIQQDSFHFERPKKLQRLHASLQESLDAFVKKDWAKLKQDDTLTDVFVFNFEQKKSRPNNIKINGQDVEIPSDPYLILETSLFNQAKTSDDVVQDLKNYLNAQDKSWFEKSYYLYLTSKNHLKGKTTVFNTGDVTIAPKYILSKENIILINEEGLRIETPPTIETPEPIEDEFDDTTRLTFFIKERKVFNRKKSLVKMRRSKTIQAILKTTSLNSLKDKVKQFKEVLKQIPSEKIKIGLENKHLLKIAKEKTKKLLQQVTQKVENKYPAFKP